MSKKMAVLGVDVGATGLKATLFSPKFDIVADLGRKPTEADKGPQQAIKKIVSLEDPHAPLSDEQIVKELVHQKIVIARRTVAKYREMLGILSSAKRKQYY